MEPYLVIKEKGDWLKGCQILSGHYKGRKAGKS